MKDFRYLAGVTTLKLDRETCVGCGMCTHVCPHQVFSLKQGKAAIIDRDGCMECGACATNCPVRAVSVTPGVGCASLIVKNWLKRLGVSTSGGCC